MVYGTEKDELGQVKTQDIRLRNGGRCKFKMRNGIDRRTEKFVPGTLPQLVARRHWQRYDTENMNECKKSPPPAPMPPHVLVDFVVFPPGHGRSVTDL